MFIQRSYNEKSAFYINNKNSKFDDGKKESLINVI